MNGTGPDLMQQNTRKVNGIGFESAVEMSRKGAQAESRGRCDPFKLLCWKALLGGAGLCKVLALVASGSSVARSFLQDEVRARAKRP